jgi:hypothetical protein
LDQLEQNKSTIPLIGDGHEKKRLQFTLLVAANDVPS